MEDNSKGYIEIAIGSVACRGMAVRPDKLKEHIKPKTELYRSMFILDETAFDHFRDQKSIRSYRGTFGLDRIIFDVDKGKDSGNEVILRAKALVEQLIEMGCDKKYIRVWFSGRGFHIDIPNLYGFKPSETLPSIVKQTIDKDFGNTIDNIYDRGRLIRVGYSFNMKSQLYKIPLKIIELYELDYKDIIELAKVQVRQDFQPEIVSGHSEIWNDRIFSEVKETPKPVKSDSKYNSNVTCVQKMFDANKTGRRHIMIMRMANAWKRMGIPKDMAIQGIAHNVPSLEGRDVIRTINDVYQWEHSGYGCNDLIMKEFCDAKCRYFKEKNFKTEIYNVNELSNRFREFMQTDFSDSSFNLRDMYAIRSDYNFMGGELVILIGDTKLGKTAWLQNVIAPLKHMNILFLSLEVNEWMIYRRFAQVANKLTKEDVNDIYTNNNEAEIAKIEASLKHIRVMTTSPNIETIKEIVSDENPHIVVIDTIDAVDVPFERDVLGKQDKVINKLKAIANEYNMIFFGISHISKSASNEPLTVHSAKGSSAIEQKADKIIGITGDREGSPRRFIRSLASRDEDGFELECEFDYTTFQFKEIK